MCQLLREENSNRFFLAAGWLLNHETLKDTFNSRFLGFSLASIDVFLDEALLGVLFQFPFLGIFPCITHSKMPPPRLKQVSFQFPFLGIFRCIAPLAIMKALYVPPFQFPFLGIFPCIINGIYCDAHHTFNFQFPFLGIFPCIFAAV